MSRFANISPRGAEREPALCRTGGSHLLLCCGLALTTGCFGLTQNPPEGSEPTEPAQVVADPAPEADPDRLSVFDRPLVRLAVEFKVHRVSANRGAFGADSALWQIASGPLPEAAAALRLAANGFRAAVGRESDRRALLTFLERLDDPRIAVDQVLPDASRLVEIEIGHGPPSQRLFFYDRGGTLRGMDFVQARARIKWSFELRSTNLKEVWLRVIPELEEPAGPPKWELAEDGTARQVPQRRLTTFDQLAFAARIPEGGFLLLGPTEAVYDRPLLGRAFFVEPAAGDADNLENARENIYIIGPIVRSSSGERTLGKLGSS